MHIWTIGDLHLSFGVPEKKMDIFGSAWENHAEKIATHWKALVHPEDLVLIPGDISWAMRLEEAAVDLAWIHHLPGTKVMIKGNHDYWWGSLKQVSAILPPSIHLIQNNAFHWRDAAIGGARLWDTPEYRFDQFIEFQENPRKKSSGNREEVIQEEFSQKIFARELERLKMSLKQMNPNAKIRIAMTHYPPIGADLQPSRASQILEQNQIQICVFGHLHNVKSNCSLFGVSRGVSYFLASTDYIRHQPIAVL
ncbi:MAG TPA: metallophosphoesterase [Chlamydiales bacterium]|nr:metallophosphoesterase [Chlamydiales bacterium]